jgi:calcineurin-like phosphoesterase family protein
VKTTFLTLLSALSAASGMAAEEATGLFSFGAIADCQYHSSPGEGRRKYSLSADKLTSCVNHLNTMNLAFVVHLGDFIDRDSASLEVVGPMLGWLTAPHYHVLGNHDFDVVDEEKADVPARMGLRERYYDFAVQRWRMVVLDGNDISLHAYPKNSTRDAASRRYYEALAGQAPTWNGAVGQPQLAWLREVLEGATASGEQVLILCHFPVFPENPHNLWNADDVLAAIDPYPCVKAYINGHNHDGHYAARKGVHFLTLKGMVDTEQTAYATITVWPGRLEVKGYGREESRSLPLR